ncbi:MAG: hypothetical protein LV471_02375 [Nitrosomonas sp.]|nr:hypothetical protein [Nitrosomonas sp.]
MNHQKQKKKTANGRAKNCLLVVAVWVFSSTAGLAADVGLSLRIGQPGFYGEIHLGDFFPPPVLIYPNPVIIYTPPNVVQQPLYLHVPYKHAKNWRRFCIQYRACDRPVYFVREQWYNDVYIPHYNQQHRHNIQPRYYDSHPAQGYDSHRYYDDKHDRRDKAKDFKDKDFRRGYDKHDLHDRGRGKKHDD